MLECVWSEAALLLLISMTHSYVVATGCFTRVFTNSEQTLLIAKHLLACIIMHKSAWYFALVAFSVSSAMLVIIILWLLGRTKS